MGIYHYAAYQYSWNSFLDQLFGYYIEVTNVMH